MGCCASWGMPRARNLSAQCRVHSAVVQLLCTPQTEATRLRLAVILTIVQQADAAERAPAWHNHCTAGCSSGESGTSLARTSPPPDGLAAQQKLRQPQRPPAATKPSRGQEALGNNEGPGNPEFGDSVLVPHSASRSKASNLLRPGRAARGHDPGPSHLTPPPTQPPHLPPLSLKNGISI